MASCFHLLVLCWMQTYCVNSPAWLQNISTNIFYLPGDIMLGGLFSINLSQRTESNNISCERLNHLELGLALVMKYTVDEINANQTLLPGIKLGYEIHDTCSQAASIVRPTLSFLTDKNGNALSVQCNYTNYETSVAAVIGPYNSEMVLIVGKLLGFFLMPQISFGATSDKLSDKDVYPSFLRTVTSDKWQVGVMVRLIEEFGWNWVAVVGSDEAYGQQGTQKFTKLAETKSVCVAYHGLVPVYSDPAATVRNIVDNIQANKVKVVVVFSLPVPAAVFFKEVIKRNITGVWIASSSWVVHNEVTSLPGIQTIGTVIGFLDKTQSLDLLPAYARVFFTKLSEQKIKPVMPQHNDPCPQCWNMTPANLSLILDAAVQRTSFAVYAAIYSLAQALHSMLGCSSSSCNWDADTRIFPWKLLQVLRNMSFDINGTHLVFDSNGNPNIGYTVVQWVWKESHLDFVVVGSHFKELSLNKSLFKWHTEDSQIPESTCSAACGSGQVRRVKGFHSCCFDCIDCLPGTYQADEEDIQCTRCPEGQWSQTRSTNCSKPTFEVLSWDRPAAITVALIGLLLLSCQGAVAVVYLRHRQTPMVAASGGPWSFVVLFSTMGACLSVALFLGQPGDIVCQLQLPLIFSFQMLALSVIASISLQLFFLTEFHDKVAPFLKTLKGPACWLFLIICWTLQAAFCGWHIKEGTTLSEHMKNMKIDFLRDFLSCTVRQSVAVFFMQSFNSTLAMVSFMCTFLAVKPPHQYNLARDITFSMLNYSIIWGTFIPIYMGLKSEKGKHLVLIAFNLTAIFGLVAGYFFPKCYLLLRKPGLNTSKYFSNFLEGAPLTSAREDSQSQPSK
ncbi:taste receptor type 1 member 3 [Entelurus aequoreus]|uniref:taste receptor type 1 member 3 n=1 Tax=Entelurus aequoreus TaxID=161455 RepID=UPI002B1E80D8|nr:taste receptor type 1 member 3 [Entelurus aequoreus]